MGIFRKESKTHFVRDEAGKVIEVQSSGDKPRNGIFRDRSPVYHKLEKEHYEAHPKESPRYKRQQRIERIGKAAKRIDKAVVGYNRNRNIMRPGTKQYSSYSPRNNYNPIGGMFDMGMSRPSRPRKKTSKTKYAVVGGRAYPIAGTGKKSKKKTKRKSTKSYDPFNAFGGYKF